MKFRNLMDDIKFWWGVTWRVFVGSIAPFLFLMVVSAAVFLAVSRETLSTILSNISLKGVALTIGGIIVVALVYNFSLRFFDRNRRIMFRLFLVAWSAINIYTLRSAEMTTDGFRGQFFRGFVFVSSLQVLLWAFGLRFELFGNVSEENAGD